MLVFWLVDGLEFGSVECFASGFPLVLSAPGTTEFLRFVWRAAGAILPCSRRVTF